MEAKLTRHSMIRVGEPTYDQAAGESISVRICSHNGRKVLTPACSRGEMEASTMSVTTRPGDDAAADPRRGIQKINGHWKTGGRAPAATIYTDVTMLPILAA